MSYRGLIITLLMAMVVMFFNVSDGLLMAAGACFAAWIDFIRARGQG